MKVFYESQNLRLSKFVALLFRGGGLFNKYFELPTFIFLEGLSGGFLFCDGRLKTGHFVEFP